MNSGFDPDSCYFRASPVCGNKDGSGFTIFFMEADGTIVVAGFGVLAIALAGSFWGLNVFCIFLK